MITLGLYARANIHGWMYKTIATTQVWWAKVHLSNTSNQLTQIQGKVAGTGPLQYICSGTKSLRFQTATTVCV